MKYILLLLSVLMIIVLSITGCSQPASNTSTETNVTSDIGEWRITVEIAGESPIEFTNEDAQKVGPAVIKAAMKDGDNLLEEGTWEGILLTDFLKYMGVDQYSVISVSAADGFSQELDPSRVDPKGTGFGWKLNGEILDAERGPIQLINHNRGPKWWVKNVTNITIIK